MLLAEGHAAFATRRVVVVLQLVDEAAHELEYDYDPSRRESWVTFRKEYRPGRDDPTTAAEGHHAEH